MRLSRTRALLNKLLVYELYGCLFTSTPRYVHKKALTYMLKRHSCVCVRERERKRERESLYAPKMALIIY